VKPLSGQDVVRPDMVIYPLKVLAAESFEEERLFAFPDVLNNHKMLQKNKTPR